MQPDAPQKETAGSEIQLLLEAATGLETPQRVRIAGQIAAFLGNEEIPAAERKAIIPVALALLADSDPEVREALALGLVNCKEVDADLLFAIIADDDDIALPFLSFSPAVNHWHMLAVLRVGDEARQACVALRPDIAEEAVTYAIDSLPLKIVELLLGNADAAFTADHYRRLFARFGDSREVVDWLLARADLPLDVRLAQARNAARNLQQLILERGYLPANDAVELVAEAEENAVLKILTQASPPQLASVVAAVVEQDMLTPAIIVRAACLGAMDIFAEMLAYLADMPFRRARALMLGRRGGGFRTLHAKAGLPQSCYWTLQAACDVAREEREEGLRLSPDDFGRRMIETLLTRYESLPLKDRPKQLDFVGRFAADRARLMAQRIKADLARAA